MLVRSRFFQVVAVLILVLAAGCTTSGTVEVSAPASNLSAALRLAPADAGTVTVVDLSAAKRTWGLEQVTSALDPDDPAVETFREQVLSSGLSATLLTYGALLEDTGWNGYDVDQQILISADAKPPVSIYRMRDDLDMQAVIDSLVADGWTRFGPDESPHFTPDRASSELQIISPSGFTVVPAENLLVGGVEGAWSIPQDGGLSTSQALTALVGGDDATLMLATVSLGAAACIPVTSLVSIGGGALSPEQVEQILADVPDLATIDGALVATTTDGEAFARTHYADEATAERDLVARTEFLSEGTSVLARRPYSELLTDARVTRDGAVLDYRFTPSSPNVAAQMAQQRDAPWAVCG